MAIPVPWPTSTNPGSAPGEGSGRLVNCYAYSDGGQPRFKPVPGLDAFASVSGPARGFILVGGTLVAVVGDTAINVDALGNVIQLEGSVPGDGPVSIARNNAVPTPSIVVVTNSGPVLIENGVVKSYANPNVSVANSVSFLDGYLLMTTAAGTMWASDLNSTNVDALSFDMARAKPGGLVRGVVYGQQFLAFGPNGIEVFQDSGLLHFPLTRSTVIPIGLLAPWAIAGFEDGWAGPLIFVAPDNSVRLLDGGYTPERISTEDLEKRIEQVAVKTDLRARVYTFGGNAIWSLSSPDWTWEFNVTTRSWHERQSYLQTGWRGDRSVFAFGRWIVGDASSGALYTVNADGRVEGPDPLIWGMDSGPVKQFPIRVAVPDAAFDFVLGQADIGNKPDAMLSWSRDGGGSWATPVQRTLAMQGNLRGRVTVARLGLSSAAGVRLRFRVSDPAYTSFAGAVIDAQGRR